MRGQPGMPGAKKKKKKGESPPKPAYINNMQSAAKKEPMTRMGKKNGGGTLISKDRPKKNKKPPPPSPYERWNPNLFAKRLLVHFVRRAKKRTFPSFPPNLPDKAYRRPGRRGPFSPNLSQISESSSFPLAFWLCDGRMKPEKKTFLVFFSFFSFFLSDVFFFFSK